VGRATWAATAAAGLFAFAHLPSPILMLITLVFGLGACLFFVRYRNLSPLIVAHAVLGIAIAITVPAQIDHDMSVGLEYVTYMHQTAALSQP